MRLLEQSQTMEAFRTPAWLGLHVVLNSSSLLNALFFAHRFLSASPPASRLGPGAADNDGGGLSWALQAAREAEAVAATDCSGHGRVFQDGVTDEDGRPGCECNTCFGGPDCSVRTPNCTADADRYSPPPGPDFTPDAAVDIFVSSDREKSVTNT